MKKVYKVRVKIKDIDISDVQSRINELVNSQGCFVYLILNSDFVCTLVIYFPEEVLKFEDDLVAFGIALEKNRI